MYSFFRIDIKSIVKNNPEIKWHLSFNNFIDVHIPLAFNALVNMGTTYYALYKLDLILLKKNMVVYPGVFDCARYAMALTPVVKVDNSEIPFEGFVWDITSAFFGLIVFIWSVVFLTVSLDELTGQKNTDSNLSGAPTDPDMLGQQVLTGNQKNEKMLKEIIRVTNDIFLQMNRISARIGDLEAINRDVISKNSGSEKSEIQEKDDLPSV